MGKKRQIIVKTLVILLFWIIHPIAFFRMLYHCQTMNHHYDMYCINFRYGVECHECGKVFCDE